MNDFDLDALIFGVKVCPNCGEPKPRNSEHFGKDAACDDGLRNVCRECRNRQQKARYRRDPSKFYAKTKACRERRAARG